MSQKQERTPDSLLRFVFTLLAEDGGSGFALQLAVSEPCNIDCLPHLSWTYEQQKVSSVLWSQSVVHAPHRAWGWGCSSRVDVVARGMGVK